MINIYEKNETTFTNNGLATLEPMTCDLSMTINGAWVLSVEHPYDQEGKWTELQKGRIIQVTGINVLRNCSTSQRYRIYDTTKTLTSINVIAFPIGMEATYDAVIEELKVNKKNAAETIQLLRDYFSDENKYTLNDTNSGLSSTKKRTMEYKNTNLIAVLCGSEDKSLVNKFNAEIAYNNYEILIRKSIGNNTSYDVRLGKNLTGLSYDLDDSSVVTRAYPISNDGVRLNERNSGSNRYIDSDNIRQYPHTRASFIEAPYSLIDTDVDALVKTDTINLTSNVYNDVFEATEYAIANFWNGICSNNKFTYGLLEVDSIPEYVQKIIKDISTTVSEYVLDNVFVEHSALRSWLTKAINAGMEWIKDEDLPDKNWIENQDHSYSYGNGLRDLTEEWAYIDSKMSYFDSNSLWVPQNDDKFKWDWVQKKGQAKKYGNNKRYFARDTYVYTMSSGGVFTEYWFDSDGWWNDKSDESDWNWYQSGDKWWFGESDAGSDSGKYAHDCWLFIKSSNDSSTDAGKPTLYYFDKDGFMVPSLSIVNIDWDWHQSQGKWWFGSSNKENRATYISDQWLKIDSDWYNFDPNGYLIDPKDTLLQITSFLQNYLAALITSNIQTGMNSLYSLLNEHLTNYCKDLYADGLDKPLINVSIDFVDLSKTQEYASFSALETICLGDSVKVTYDTSGSYVEEEVVGLVYDCLKGCNTQITVGRASKTVSQMFDTSVKGADNGQRLVAGENVTITGNTINVSSQVGDVYAGDTVSVQQIQSTGTPIARISVNGIPTTIYAVGTDVQVNPIKQSGDKIATITVGVTSYDIYADSGLKYWTETQRDIYRTGQHTETSFNSNYYFEREVTWQVRSNYSYHGNWDFKKENDVPAYIGLVNNGYDVVWDFCFVSESADGIKWLVKDWGDGASAQFGYPPQGEYIADYNHTGNFTYKNKTYYYSVSRCYYDNTSQTTSSFQWIPNVTYEDSYVNIAKALIDATEISTTVNDIFGISNDPNSDKILWWSNNGTYASHTDDVYITKDGVFNGKEFKINGQSIGGFYKTTLYQGNAYASSISLSDSYTSYDLLMIETYNADDKQNLASIVNVSDLSTASYVGVVDYLMYTITNGRTLTFHEAPSDSNHSRYVKAVYGMRTSHDSGTESPIEDVTVDGVSVVSGGVANIGVGANLNFSNGVLSATNTTYSDFAGSSHGLVPAVQTQSGKYLKDDGTWGTPSGGGGGASALNDLSDVNISSLSDGQVLTYDITTQKWINASGGSRDYYIHDGNIGGGASASAYPTVNLDKPLTEGLYLAVVNDTEDWHTGVKWFHWGNNTTSKQLVVGGSSGNIVFTIDNINETVTTTQYSGNWRDIFLSIIKVDI